MTQIIIDAIDAEGRYLSAADHPLSRIVINRHSFIDINSLVEWEISDETGSGDTGWGKDQDMWPTHTFSAYQRAMHGKIAKKDTDSSVQNSED